MNDVIIKGSSTSTGGKVITGSYDAVDTAKRLGGYGVQAYVKRYNGVDYLILKGYKKHFILKRY